ncbi:MAG: MBL fold metallo-hydrolase [Clostridiales bacterium]|nr:MBL fold metallo-hydrolase [Clostridiales bacterium]
MKIERIVCGAYAENAYCIDGELLIDPGDDLPTLARLAGGIKAILLTHGHFDHMLAAEELQKRTGVPVYVHPLDAPMLSDASLSAYNPEVSSLPQPGHIACTAYPESLFGFRVLHTPGHTPGSVCLYHEGEKVLFSGDTLFRAGFGRTDLAGGSMHQLLSSLRTLLALPRDVRVYPGHGESTTIDEECRRYRR